MIKRSSSPLLTLLNSFRSVMTELYALMEDSRKAIKLVAFEVEGKALSLKDGLAMSMRLIRSPLSYIELSYCSITASQVYHFEHDIISKNDLGSLI